MVALPFRDDSFDLIWSEGSAYLMGFENALYGWKRLLRNEGCLVLTDLVWLTAAPSPAAAAYWQAEYPDMTDAATRLLQAEAAAYRLVDQFVLPQSDWEAYYNGIREQLQPAIAKHGRTPAVAELEAEIRMFDRHGAEYGYLCLVLQKKG
jgi:SAM-dependent methyltransferase